MLKHRLRFSPDIAPPEVGMQINIKISIIVTHVYCTAVLRMCQSPYKEQSMKQLEH